MIQQQLEWNICPLGYNARGADQALDRLMQDERVLLIDTRLKPWSVRPEWRREAMEKKYGRRYRYAGVVLGNLNYNIPDSEIELANWREGKRGLLLYLSEGYKLILLCGCREYSGCHRKRIVELLCATTPGIRVMEPDLSVVQPVQHEMF